MLRTLLTLVIPSFLVAAVGFGASTLAARVDADPSPWVNWGGRSFSSPEDLRGWLRARGLTYRGWARNHPYAAARLEGREPPPRTQPAENAPPEEAAPPPAPIPAQAEAVAQVEGPPTRSFVDRLVLVVLLVLTAGLVVLAAMPPAVLFAVNAPLIVHERRAELLAAGLALGAGVLAAQLLSSS